MRVKKRKMMMMRRQRRRRRRRGGGDQSSSSSSPIQRSLPFIEVMMKSKPYKNKVKLLKFFPQFVTDDIIEFIYNIVTQKLPVECKDIEKLKKFQNKILHLLNIPDQRRRRTYMYNQTGGFLGAFLPIIASLVGGLVSGLTSSSSSSRS